MFLLYHVVDIGIHVSTYVSLRYRTVSEVAKNNSPRRQIDLLISYAQAGISAAFPAESLFKWVRLVLSV
jgi:hypothetical protein